MKYEYLWRNRWLTDDCNSIDDFIERFKAVAEMFEEWKEAGVVLDPESGIDDDFAIFTTEDETFAEENKFDQPYLDEDEWVDEKILDE